MPSTPLLSLFVYLLRNWIKRIPFVLITTLSIVATTVTAAIANSAQTDYRQNLHLYNHFAVVQLPNPDTHSRFETFAQQSDAVNFWLDRKTSFVLTRPMITSMRRPIFFVEEAEAQVVLIEFLVDLLVRMQENYLNYLYRNSNDYLSWMVTWYCHF